MKIFYKISLSVFILGTALKPVMAQETVDPDAEVKPGPPETPRSSRDNRTDKDLTLLVIPITLGWVLPTKYGVSATWISDATWSIEAEYLQASYGLGFWGVDMANLSEQHTSIHALYYPGNSYYWKVGLGRREYKATFGSEYLSRISSNNLLTPAKVQISNDVLTLGLGNRWQFKSGITFGIEWLDLVFAMGQGRIEENFMDRVNDKDEQDDLQTLFDYFRHGTTFQILKVTLGYSF